MKFKKLIGNFFVLTLITTAVFGFTAENSRQGFDRNFTSLHQAISLGKAAFAPGFLACFLDSSRQVFLSGKAIKTWDDLDRLTSETFLLSELADSPRTWQFSFNSAGYRIGAADPQNKSYTYQYDPASNLISMGCDSDGTSYYQYDSAARNSARGNEAEPSL